MSQQVRMSDVYYLFDKFKADLYDRGFPPSQFPTITKDVSCWHLSTGVEIGYTNREAYTSLIRMREAVRMIPEVDYEEEA